jgi:hypothetical protein
MENFTLVSGMWQEEIKVTGLDEAMKIADENIGYNQESMKILDEEGECVAIRRWCSSLEGIEDCENPVQYGEFGYYDDWSNE